ncbi:RidA family protein [Chelativorans sp.]|uniref:RidA family protein n=1 Tax=Chelativorans sp. TaxID=2203393 RepID=UPI0028125AC8|nr:RidA family protein [Chelativorans sp.]
MLTMINPAGYPVSPFYSQAVEAKAPRRMLFVSGQVGVDATGYVGADIGEQARIAVANLNAVLAEAGMDKQNLAKVTIYLTDESLLPDFMQAAGESLPSPPPATTLLVVKALAAPSLLIEIEAIAVA